MKWNVDKALFRLEVAIGLGPGHSPGTMASRALTDVTIMKREGVKPTPEEVEKGYAMIWCLTVGQMLMPKRFFYGRTIREAYLRARRVLKPALTKVQQDRARDRRRAKKKPCLSGWLSKSCSLY